MGRLKLKQVLSNLQYEEATSQLILSGSASNIPDLIISGSTEITSSQTNLGTLTIDGINTFGDSGSFDTLDLGDY